MTYDFSITGVLKEGFNRTDGVKLTFFGAFFIYVIISVIVSVLLGFIFTQKESFLNELASSMVEMIITLPVLVGMMMLGLKKARDEDFTLSDIFNYFNMFLPIVLAYLLMTSLIFVGFLLLVIPGIYLTISYAFVYPLIVDKGLGIWEAMELSRKTVTKQWFKFFGLSFLGGIIVIISVIPLGIGLLWTVPMIYITYGLLYHHLFDEEDEARKEEVEEIKEIENN